MLKQDVRQLTGIDLFAGAGGLSLGFEEAGFTIIYAVEKDKCAAETYRRNRKGRTLIEEDDVLHVEPDRVLDKLGMHKGDLHVLLGGPPCQGFSPSNMRTRNMQNPMNQLVFRFLDFVKCLMPAWFVMENVAGLDKFQNGKVKEKLLDLMRESGYTADAVVLDASCFEVPQVRKRIFLVGNRIGKALDFLHDMAEKATQSPVTAIDAIGDLPILPNGNSVDQMRYSKNGKERTKYQAALRAGNGDLVSNNLVSRSSALILERYKWIRQGENLRVLLDRKPELLNNYKDLNNCHQWIYWRLCCNKPSVVISNYRKNMLIHPEQDRGLSVREAARLQSFPDKYVFFGGLGYQQQQVADAVPPRLAYALALNIKNMIS